MGLRLLLLLLISSCSFSIEPIQDTKVNCDTKDLTKLEMTKCEMELRLLELKY